MKIEQKSTVKISQSFKNVGQYLGLGTQLAASIILMFFLGRWLDAKFNSTPLMILICSFIGGFAGIYNFIHTVLQLNQKKKDGEQK